MTLRGLAPTKLYRPIVPVVAALSYRNDSLEPSDTFRYACVGVKKSAEIWAHKGTRFGGCVDDLDLERREETSSREGCICA